MKKFLIAAALATLVSAGAGLGVSQAKPGPEGGNSSKQGLCTAYYNGHKTGWGKDGHSTPPPFAALETAADNADSGNQDGTATPQEVLDYCGGAGAIGGNPGQNGRFTDCFTDTNQDSTDDCTDG